MKYLVLARRRHGDYHSMSFPVKPPLNSPGRPIWTGSPDRERWSDRYDPAGIFTGSDRRQSDAAGYDPLLCYTGRGPWKRPAWGHPGDQDVAFRCNLVTLSESEDPS